MTGPRASEPPAPALPPPPPATPRTARPRPPWPVVLVALAVAAVSLAVALALAVLDTTGRGGPGEAEGLEADRVSALDAVRERTLALTTYDHRTLEQDFQAVLDTATGAFRQEYGSTTASLRPVLTGQQAVATASVVAAGLESATDDRAVAVVAVDQVISTAGAAPRTEQNRLRMTLVRPERTWLVERVERL